MSATELIEMLRPLPTPEERAFARDGEASPREQLREELQLTPRK